MMFLSWSHSVRINISNLVWIFKLLTIKKGGEMDGTAKSNQYDSTNGVLLCTYMQSGFRLVQN